MKRKLTPEAKKAIRTFATDAAMVAGIAAFVYGLGLAWRPLWFIAGGAALAAAAYIVGDRA